MEKDLLSLIFLQRNGAVEDEAFGSRVEIDVVVARAGELQVVEGFARKEEFFHKSILVDTDAVGVDEGAHGFDTAHAIFFLVLLDGIARVLAGPKTFVVAHFCGEAVVAAEPVDRALHLAVCTRSSRL